MYKRCSLLHHFSSLRIPPKQLLYNGWNQSWVTSRFALTHLINMSISCSLAIISTQNWKITCFHTKWSNYVVEICSVCVRFGFLSVTSSQVWVKSNFPNSSWNCSYAVREREFKVTSRGLCFWHFSLPMYPSYQEGKRVIQLTLASAT